MPESATFEAIQTQELDDDSLLKDTLSVTVKGDEKLLNAEYMAVKSYKGNAQTFDMYRIVTDTTPDKSMSFTGMSLAPYELNGHIIQDLRPANHSLSYTLNRILADTDWQLGYIDDGLPNVTTNFYYVSAKEALKELQSLVGCEFVFKVEISGQKITDKWIEVYKEMGNRTKKRFNYGTNALTVVRETNKADIYTALIGRGKGEEVSLGEDNASGQAGYGRKITFEDIEWKKSSGKPLDKPKGQYYLELPQATQAYGIKNIDGTMKARVGIVDFGDEEDKNRLINLTYQQLLVSSRPKVLFKTTVANIGATGIGDTVTIHRHDLNIHYQTRVRKIVRNKLNDNKTQIELGDAVVTASTKQTKQNNATIKNLNNEIDKIKANVTTSQNSADGKNTIFYGSAEPERQRTGDTWYRPHPSIAGETQMLTWNGTAWELVIDTSDLTSVSRAVEEAAEKADEAVQAAKDADAKANSALEKAGANANLLTTHQNTIDTINTVTLTDISSTVGDALANAKDAMDEAKKADDKIADYVKENGLVSGTTVDSKIDDATGAISKTIRTVEGKIPTEVGGRNYVLKSNVYYYTKDYKVAEYDLVTIPKDTKIKVSIWGGLDSGARTFGIYINNGDGTASGNSQKFELTKQNGTFGRGRSTSLSKWTAEVTLNVDAKKILIYGFDNDNTTPKRVEYVKIETGGLFTDWTVAPEDNYTQEEFKIFESTYDEDVKGIRSSLSVLENDKLDGSTYTTFYKNEYKKTAEGVKDAYEKIGKVVDENGNTTDTFAKAVYDQNATRRTEDFNEVTKDLVKEATYTAGINGLSGSISSVRGQIDKLTAGGGGRNYALKSNAYYYTTNYKVAEYDLAKMLKGTKIKISIWGALDTNVRTFRVYINNSNGTGSGNSQIIELTKLDGIHGQGVSAPLSKWTAEATLGVDATKILIFGVDNNTTSPKRIEYVKVETGETFTDWTIAPEDMLGKADFQVFKTTYEANDKTIKERLLAVDSGKEGSIAYRLNETEKTASGNTTTISDIKTKPGEQITGYQTIKERSELYERVIGKDEAGIKSNMARMVMTDSLFKTEVIKNVPSLIGGRNYVLKSNDYYYTSDYMVAEYNLSVIPKGTKIKISIWGALSSSVRTFGVYVNNSSGVTSGNSQKIELTKLDGVYGRGRSAVLSKWTAEVTLSVDASKILIYGFDNNSTSPKRIEYVQIETGDYYTDWTAAPEDKASVSAITQLEDSISLKVSSEELLNEINVQAKGILIQSGTNKLNVTPETTYIEDSTIKSAMIESLEADKIKTGTLDAGEVEVINLDAENITSNKTKFIQSTWNDIESSIKIDGSGLLSTARDSSQVYLQNGIVGARNPQGATIGQIGYAYQTESPWYSMQISHGSHFQIRMNRAEGELNKQAFYIISGGTESYLNTDNIYLNPAITGRVRVQGAMTVDKDLRVDGTILVRSRLEYLNGGYIESQSANSNILINATNKLIIYTNGTNALEFDANNAVFRRKISDNSDIRLKTNIVDMPINSLEAIRNIEIKKFDYLDGRKNYYGIIAQQAQNYLPELINTDSNGYLMVDKSAMTYVNMHAIQQLNTKVEDEITQLKAQIASLQDELALLKGA